MWSPLQIVGTFLFIAILFEIYLMKVLSENDDHQSKF